MVHMTYQQGIRENKHQFLLLVLVNAFVGGMLGIERSIFPQFAKQIFEINSHFAILSFIIAFGIAKAITNYFTGKFAQFIGRKNLLVIGWIFALSVVPILLNASNWNWVIFANVLLGISQGLTWSSTIVMKIDLVGERNRGLAMGLNESSGYLAMGGSALLTSYIASEYGLFPYPFYLGLVISGLGLVISMVWIKDTEGFVKFEAEKTEAKKNRNIFAVTSWKSRTLSAVTQAGFVNNLNDGMIWGLLPILLQTLQFSQTQIGIVAGIYPIVWGIGQLFTGKLSDHLPKKNMLFWGMFIQGIAILLMTIFTHYWAMIGISIAIGIGTALVYPTFLTIISQHSHPLDRAESIGVFRLWRDLGYAFGAILSGLIADQLGIYVTIIIIGLITILSSLIIQWRMKN